MIGSFEYYNLQSQIMKTEENLVKAPELPLFDPLAIFSQQLKNKTIKKQAVLEVQTIALALSPKQIKEDLVPLLIKAFVQQSTEMRVAILLSFTKLLDLIDSKKDTYPILQFVIDVLCVFNEEDIRKQAFRVLQIVIRNIDLKSCSGDLKKVIEQLNKQGDKNILETQVRLVRYMFEVADQDQQEFLFTIIKRYREDKDYQYLLVQQLKELIKMAPLFPLPEVYEIIKETIEQGSSKSKIKVVESVLLLGTLQSSHDIAKQYILSLFKDTDSEVVASLILQVKNIIEIFSEQVQSEVWKIVDSYEGQNLVIKTAIIEVLEHIPLTEERKTKVLGSHNINKALSLSKALASSLCKIQDIQSLKFIIQNSDTQFKNKLFPKLPPTCELHIALMEHLFSQKNWRNKLTLLQNIEKRLEQDEKVEILLPKLLQQIGDKIAVFRMAVIKLVGLIMKTKKIRLASISRELDASINCKNWFERQASFLLLEERSKEYNELDRYDQEIIRKAVKQGLLQKIENIRQIATSIRQKCKIRTDD